MRCVHFVLINRHRSVVNTELSQKFYRRQNTSNIFFVPLNILCLVVWLGWTVVCNQVIHNSCRHQIKITASHFHIPFWVMSEHRAERRAIPLLR